MNKRLTAAEQIEAMKELTQSAASWLLGFRSSRSLRDAPDAPRTPSGAYDARALVEWFADRAAGPLDEMGVPVAAPDSPATERWRRARALDVETKVLERLGELVDVAETRAAVKAVFTPVRDFATQMILAGRLDAGEWDEVCEMAAKELDRLRPPGVAKRELRLLPHGEAEPIVVDLTKLAKEDET